MRGWSVTVLLLSAACVFLVAESRTFKRHGIVEKLQQRTAKLAGKRAEAADFPGCVAFSPGEGVGIGTANIGNALDMADCIRLVKTTRPYANGASMIDPSKYGPPYTCYATVQQTSVNSSPYTINCLLDPNDIVTTPEPSPAIGCKDYAVGATDGEKRPMEKTAWDMAECIALVKENALGANAAEMTNPLEHQRPYACYAVFGQTSVAPISESWINCYIVTGDAAAEVEDTAAGPDGIEDGDSEVPVIETDSSPAKNEDWTVANVFDGSESADMDENSCYHSAQDSGAWLQAFFPERVSVKRVWLLNRGDCCGSDLDGTRVLVCDGDNCVQCGGVFRNSVTGAWDKRFCGKDGGLIGDSIKVVADENYLTVCEIKVRGRDLNGNRLGKSGKF
jgi:hypothetical protein